MIDKHVARKSEWRCPWVNYWLPGGYLFDEADWPHIQALHMQAMNRLIEAIRLQLEA